VSRVQLWLTVGVAAALANVGVAPHSAAAATASAGISGCQEHQAFVDGDEAAVSAHLPKRYTRVQDPFSNRPLLFVRGLRCRGLTLDASSAPATMASFGIVIDSPDGQGCASGAPVVGMVKGDIVPACNWYTLFWLANDRPVVDWLRSGTPDFPAVYVPGLVFELGTLDPTQGGGPFHFQAPAPAPSPFRIDALTRERPGAIPIRGGYWVDTPRGTVKLAFSSEDVISGDATGVVTAAPRSEMAALFGASQRSYVPGYTLFAALRYEHAVYRKQLQRPADNAISGLPAGGEHPPSARQEAVGLPTTTSAIPPRAIAPVPVVLMAVAGIGWAVRRRRRAGT
jgi:hypothetical protein